jgi:hypothetical protein
MFTDHADEVTWCSPIASASAGMAEQGNVVGLCGPAGEDQLFS